MKSRFLFLLFLVLALIGLFIFPATPPQIVNSSTLRTLTISADPYKHFNGVFTMRLPVGWAVNVRDDGLLVSEPQSGGMIDLELINTGLPLDALSLTRYVDAVEENFFATSANYRLLEHNTTPDGCHRVRKNLDVKGVKQLVVSYYCSSGNVVSQQDFWATADRAEAYVGLYEDVLKSLQVDIKMMQSFQPYRERYFFVDLSRSFEFRVPYSWAHRSQEGGGYTLETFTAPDSLNVVQHLRADVGSPSSQSQLIKFVQSEIRRVNGFNTMNWGESQLHSSDLWQITWATDKVRGQSLLKSSGNTVYALTWFVQKDKGESFGTLGAGLLEGYHITK